MFRCEHALFYSEVSYKNKQILRLATSFRANLWQASLKFETWTSVSWVSQRTLQFETGELFIWISENCLIIIGFRLCFMSMIFKPKCVACPLSFYAH